MRQLPTAARVCLKTLAVMLVAALASKTSVVHAAPKASHLVCGFNSWYGSVPWAMVAMQYYSPLYPLTTFDFNILNSGDDLRGMVQTYLADGAPCDVLALVGYSPYALALSPVMADTVAWVDGSATSTDLSDKAYNPTFNRVIPTDAVGAGSAAVFVHGQEWKQVNVLCNNDAYGRSVADGFSKRLQVLGGEVEFSRCVPATYTAADFKSALDTILDSAESRVVFLAGAFGDLAIDVIVNSTAYNRAVFILSESMCSSGYMTRIPGAFCATYAIDPTKAAALQAAYVGRDIATEYARYGPYLDYAVNDTTSEIDFYLAMVVDSIHAGMRAAYEYTDADHDKYPTVAEYLRTISFEGLTGYISFDGNGDRVEATVEVFNNQPAATAGSFELLSIGRINNGSVAQSRDELYYSLDGGAMLTTPPRAFKDPVVIAQVTEFPYWVIAIIAACVVLIAGAAIVARATRPKTRDNNAAPLDESKPFTVMFTDIQSSTMQWASNPGDMGPAVDKHHALIRGVLPAFHGYEVKTIGDSFMVAFKDPMDAVRAASQIQQVLYDAQWPESIDQVYKKADDTGLYKDARAYDEVWRGLRVRIGIHTGFGSVKFDQVTLGYDYYGTVVNTAARIEGVGHGGQILVSKSTYDAMFENSSAKNWIESNVVVTNLGPQPLRGLDSQVELTQFLPHEFASRTFPPLRLDVEIEVDYDEKEDDKKPFNDTASTHSVSTAASNVNSTPEEVCGLLAKRSNLNAQDLIRDHHLVKALFSTVPKGADRAKIVADLATHWRVPMPPQRKLAASERELEVVLAHLTARAASILVVTGLDVPRGASNKLGRTPSATARRASNAQPAQMDPSSPQEITGFTLTIPGATPQ
jgi:class 3 adenylate cyclase/ABC-type branched-subunit amino acid transport system substrate-binding protein